MSGSQSQSAWRLRISLWSMPSASPTAAASATESNRPGSAAASAGTISRLLVVASRRMIGAARISAPPARTVASAQLTMPIGFGEIPSSFAASRFSATARVVSPIRVNRYVIVRSAATVTTMPARRYRSSGATAPPSVTRSSGSGPSITSAEAP